MFWALLPVQSVIKKVGSAKSDYANANKIEAFLFSPG
jgi:hypothetical protein